MQKDVVTPTNDLIITTRIAIHVLAYQLSHILFSPSHPIDELVIDWLKYGINKHTNDHGFFIIFLLKWNLREFYLLLYNAFSLLLGLNCLLSCFKFLLRFWGAVYPFRFVFLYSIFLNFFYNLAFYIARLTLKFLPFSTELFIVEIALNISRYYPN